MGEDNNEDNNEDNEDGDDDDNDGGDDAVPPTFVPPVATAPAVATSEVVVKEEEDAEMQILEQEAPGALEIILLDEEPELPQPHIFTILMRGHEESLSRVYDGLDDPTLADYYAEDWFPKDGSHD
jgi:hypothetical protein